MNSTMKIVRGKIMDKYQGLIDYLYTPDAKAVTNERNIEEVEKMKLGQPQFIAEAASYYLISELLIKNIKNIE